MANRLVNGFHPAGYNLTAAQRQILDLAEGEATWNHEFQRMEPVPQRRIEPVHGDYVYDATTGQIRPARTLVEGEEEDYFDEDEANRPGYAQLAEDGEE